MLRRNCEVIDDAVVDYLLYKKPLEDTIYNPELPLLKYQIIKKLGGMYEDIALYRYDENNNIYLEKECINKVNRIFATTDSSYGKLMKRHNKKNTFDSVEGCPDNCLVVNYDIRELKAKDIKLDYNWYLSQAKQRIVKFLLSDDELKNFKKMSLDDVFDTIIDCK